MMSVFEFRGTVSRTRTMACDVLAYTLDRGLEVWLSTHDQLRSVICLRTGASLR